MRLSNFSRARIIRVTISGDLRSIFVERKIFLLGSSLILLLKALLLGLSFCGLCAAARCLFKLDRFIAPFAAVCGVISILMLSGMLRILPVGFGLLYLGGFAGLIYAWFVRRVRPDFALMALLALYAALLAWRFHGAQIHQTDDVSHWALVARYLLEENRFPDGSFSLIFFQSYPLGSASFIYYVSRTLGLREDVWIAAQNLLYGLLYLPVFAHAKHNKRLCIPVAAGLFVFLFQYNRNLTVLQVDQLLPFFGIGMAASILYYRSDLRRAAGLFLIGAMSVVYIKNSGMFFAFCSLALLTVVARRSGLCGKKLALLALGGAAFTVVAYLLWVFHVKLSYPAGLSTKHAISLTSYAAQLMEKGGETISLIAAEMVRQLLHPVSRRLWAIGFLLLFGGAAVFGCLHLEGQRSRLHATVRALLGCVAMLAIWYVLLFGMYVFSMPTDEAILLASFPRYEGTGLTYFIGLTALVMLCFYSRPSLTLTPLTRRLCLAAYAVATVYLVFSFFNGSGIFRTLLGPLSESGFRQRLIYAKDELQLTDGGRYLVFVDHYAPGRFSHNSYYYAKYEYRTADMVFIARYDPTEDGQTEYACISNGAVEFDTDPSTFIRRYIDTCDAFIIADEDPQFDAAVADFMQTYGGDTPVFNACS